MTGKNAFFSPTKLIRMVRFFRFWLQKRGGRQAYGDGFIVGPGARLAPGLSITVGNRVNIGAEATIQTNLNIGDDVMISSGVAFIGNDHDFSDPDRTLQEQGRLPTSTVTLEGDNLVGFGSIILGNVRVGHGAIIGAGSLVLNDVPQNTICVGRPAVPVRMRR